MSTNIEKLSTYLNAIPPKLRAIPKEDIKYKPAPNKWSKQEILGHLVDSALYNLQRFTNILINPQPFVLQSYAQDALVRVNQYQHQELEDIIQLWKNLNQQILHLWENYTSEQLALQIENPGQNNSGNLAWWITDYTEHLEHHLKQIFGNLEIPTDTKIPTAVNVVQAKAALAKEQDKRFVTLMQHGSMSIEFYEPHKIDPQQPHRQDELYIVISGSGIFYNDGQRSNFQAGDVLFVPAGIEHRFENFTADFKTWVVFYGPDGGEQKQFPKVEVNQIIDHEKYTVSNEPSRLDLDVIHQFITNSYWGKGRTKNFIKQALFHSYNFGLYVNDQQVGFARLITDHTTFNYLADVFVIASHSGKGLGKFLVETIVNSEPVLTIGKCMLHTRDAHGLYEKYDFKRMKDTEYIMSRGYPFL